MHSKKITFLSGGTGTPKLILGFREIISDEQITVIGNTGDDDEFYGLLVSPDVDTLIYLFSEVLDQEKFWGLIDETYFTLDFLSKIKEDIWFNIGDKDLAIHLLRNKLLVRNYTLEQAISEICNRFGIEAKILPMTNEKVRTKMFTIDNQKLSFQEYTVKLKEKVPIKEVEYEGSKKAKTTTSVIEAILNTDILIIGPSNPITSINPILSVAGIREALKETDALKIAISPLEKKQAFSGPAAKLLKELGFEPSSLTIAKMYRDFLDILVIGNEDKEIANKIKALGIKTIVTNISLRTIEERKEMAKKILEFKK